MELCEQILDTLTTAVLVFQENMKLAYINPAAEDLLGISANLINKIHAGEVFPHAGYVELLNNSLQHEQAFIQRNIEANMPHNAVVCVDSVATPLFDYNSNRYRHVLLEVFPQGKDRRGRELSSQSQVDATRAVVRGLAHEIKNPLGGLRGAAQLLEKELHTESLKEYTRIIIGEADRLQNLLNRMLTPNRLPMKKTTNIHRVIEHVRNLVSAELDSHTQLKRDYDPSIPEIIADEDQLIQALLNIVRNAAQALAEQNDGCIRLKTRAERQCAIGSKVHRLAARIDIMDNGPGIPEDIKEKIFYPMVTSHANGTGLGLSISQSLINHHGGSLQCRSDDSGTVFTILLPLEINNVA